MKEFGDRRTDFGESQAVAPAGMRFIGIRVGKDYEVWRVELEPDEVANVMLQEELEQQANDWSGMARVVVEVANVMKEFKGLEER
jgi:hypothetical protein